jgi:peptidoglycan biosynthesis protein MviN/MurJ (putative lipid II flippase)
MNIGLNLILIPIDIKFLGISGFGLGATGAAIATVCTAVFGFIYARAMAWYLLKLKWDPTAIIKHVMAALVMVFVLIYLSTIFEIVRWYQLTVIFLVAMGIYFGILFAIREFKKEDFDFFMDTLNPKKMINYISDELKGKK